VLKRTAGGEERRLAILRDGDVFGEIALLEHVPRIATIVTRTPCLMLTLDRQQFEQILAAVPDLRIAFEQVAAARRREDEAMLGSL
jgi:ATP-binding cassette subfamily B protein